MSRSFIIVMLVMIVVAIGVARFFIVPSMMPTTTEPSPAPVEIAAEPSEAAPAPTETSEPMPEVAPADQSDTAIFGVVTDAMTGAPIAGATITIHFEDGQAVTDRDGAYRIESVDNHGHILVRAEGYARESSFIETATNRRIDFQLYPGGGIRGTVTDADTGEGIGTLTVVAVPQDGTNMFTAVRRENSAIAGNVLQSDTDSDGTFSNSNVLEGEYLVGVMVNETGYTYTADQTRTVTVRAGESAQIDFALEYGAQVRGRVVDGDGNPVAGATIQKAHNMMATTQDFANMQLDPNRFAVPDIQTDENGDYLYPGVKRGGTIDIMASSEKFAPATTGEIAVPDETMVEAPDIVLLPGQRVAGFATYEDGAPVRDGRVILRPESMPNGWYADAEEVGELGSFAFENVPAGRYEVRLTTPETLLSPSASDEHIKLIAVEAGADVTEIVLTLPNPTSMAARIVGTVVDMQGTPVEGAEVRAEAVIGFGEGDGVETDAEGRFALDSGGMAARIEAKHDGLTAFVDNVLPGSDILLTLGSASSISGVVVDASGDPCVRCTVTLDTIAGDAPANPMTEMFGAMGGMFGNRNGVTTDADGYFRFGELAEGAYRVVAQGRESGHGASPQITLSAGDQRTGIRIILEPGATVSGRVTNRDGMNVSGATVVLSSNDEDGVMGMIAAMSPMATGNGPRSITGDDGTYTLNNVAPGVYKTAATHPEYPRTQGEVVEISSGEVLNQVDITLNNGGKVRGTLIIDGQTKPNTMINLIGAQGMFNIMTDSEGAFEIDNVPPGRYMAQRVDMAAMMGGDMSAMSQTPTIVEVADNETTELDFSPPEGSVTFSGVVQGASGMTSISLRREGAPDPAEMDPMSMELDAMMEMAMFQAGQAIARPDGTFSLEGVAPGNYIADIVSIDFDLSGGIAGLQDMDPNSFPMYSVPITVTEDGAHFEFDITTMEPRSIGEAAEIVPE